MENRRQARRVTGNSKVSAHHPITKVKVTADARLRNIGKKGFGFGSEDQLTRGLIYSFQLDFLGKLIDLTGKVVYVRNMGSYFRYGVKVVSLPFWSRIRLNRFLSANSFSIQFLFMMYALIVAGVAWAVLHYLLGITGGTALTLFFITWFAFFLFPPF